jgi:hypothetical protein
MAVLQIDTDIYRQEEKVYVNIFIKFKDKNIGVERMNLYLQWENRM